MPGAPADRAHDDPLAALLARSVRARGPVLARAYLPPVDAFKAEAKLKGVKRDAAVEQIITRLKQWQKLTAENNERGYTEANDFKRFRIATLLAEDAERWLDTHPDGALLAAGDAIRELAEQAKKDADLLAYRAVRRGGGADTRLKEHITARDMHSAFKHLAPLINIGSPTAGTKAEIEGEIELAVDPSMVGFVGLRIKLETDRQEETKIKARAECTLTAGAKIPNVGRARFEIGGYLEVQGGDATQLCQLISYGLYRTLREQWDVPRWIVNALWGGVWQTDPGYANAERWAGKVETGVMGANKEAYVEIGLMVGAMGEAGFQAGAVAAKAKAQIQAGAGERWDAAKITAVAGAKSKKGLSDADIDKIAYFLSFMADADTDHIAGMLAAARVAEVSPARLGAIRDKVRKLDKRMKAANPKAEPSEEQIKEIILEFTGRRPGLGAASKPEAYFTGQAARGERTVWVKGSAEADITVATMAIKGEFHRITKGRDSLVPSHFREAKVEGRFGVKLPLDKALTGELFELLHLEAMVSAVMNFIRTQSEVSDEDKKLSKADKNSRELGSALRGAGDIAADLLQVADVASKPFEWAGKAKSAIAPGVSGFVTLGVVLDCKWTPTPAGKKQPYEINLQIAEEKGFKYAADVAVVSGRFSAKTQERWLRFQWKHDGDKRTHKHEIASIVFWQTPAATPPPATTPAATTAPTPTTTPALATPTAAT